LFVFLVYCRFKSYFRDDLPGAVRVDEFSNAPRFGQQIDLDEDNCLTEITTVAKSGEKGYFFCSKLEYEKMIATAAK